MAQTLQRIPIPFRQRWRDFCTDRLPLLVFVCLVSSIVWMWSRYVHPSSIVGEVESVRADLVSTVAGSVAELRADRYQHVTNGEPLVVVSLLEPGVEAAELSAVEADLQLLKKRMELDHTRNLGTWSQMRHDIVDEKINLELARIKLQQATGEFTRMQKLYEIKLVGQGLPLAAGSSRNDFGYDVALRDKDALAMEVTQRSQLVEQMEADMRRLEATGEFSGSGTDDIVQKDIEAQQRKLEAAMRSVILRSPIDGFVSTINHRVGEKVTAGLPILVVSAEQSSRVVAWVRQPVSVRPKIGDAVEVRLPQLSERLIMASIIQVGTQLEPINSTLISGPNSRPNTVEYGLPFLVQLPTATSLIPGEAVEINLPKSESRTLN